MTDLSEPDDPTVRPDDDRTDDSSALAEGDQRDDVGPDATSEIGTAATAAASNGAATGKAPRPTPRDRRTAERLRARKVRRLIRHIEPWSVLKISLIFYFCLWVIFLIAGVILWNLALGAGTIDNLESFLEEILALESFEFNGEQIFQASALGGLVLVVAGSGFTVLVAVLFNLISDVTGGMRITVVEEETARPRPKRTRPRSPAGNALVRRPISSGSTPTGPPPAATPTGEREVATTPPDR